MCGIVAIFSREGPVLPESLPAAILSLSHRGPDGSGQWFSASRNIGLGHTRLSIIDLETGGQPIANEDNRLHITVNGEFYDFLKIRRELEDRGHRFRTRSDSEIALHLYEEYGPDCLKHLRGEFAFVIWDEREQTLFAARDRFGIKPLYYAEVGGTLTLASEAKALFAAGVRARWDRESLFQFHNILNYYQDRSLFRGVRQIPPGHFLIATGKEKKLIKYWDFNFPLRPANTVAAARTDEDYAKEFCHILDESVRLRMQADVPVGCYLSGGIDSASLLSLAARHTTRPIHAFTVGFDHSPVDEVPMARQMAEHVGAVFHPMMVTQADLARNFSNTIWHSETLCINLHGVAKFMLSQAVQDGGYKVVITGEGSDEILAGYLHFMRDMLLYNSEGQDLRAFQDLLVTHLNDSLNTPKGTYAPSSGENDRSSNENIRTMLGFVPTWMEASETIASEFRNLFSRDFSREFRRYDCYQNFLESLDRERQLEGRDPVNQSLYLWNKLALPNYELNVLGDRTEMAHSIEGRVPFLDHRLVEMANALPVPQKINGLAEKYILRNAVRSFVPENIAQRPKYPFLAPPATLFPSESFYELLQDTLRGPELSALPFYDQKKVVSLLERLPGMDENACIVAGNVLTGILSACMLQRLFQL